MGAVVTVEQRGNRWRAQVDVGRTAAGKRDRLSESFDTEAEAIAWEHATKARHIGQGISSEHSQTCAELLDLHYAANAPTARTTRDRWSTAWAADVRRIIDQDLVPALGDVQVRRLTIARLDDLYRAWLDEGRSAYQIRNANAVLRGALRRAVRSHVVERNVAAEAELPRLPKTERKLPTADDVRAIVQANPRLELLAQLGVATGHRLGALCGLRWSDLDLQARTVTIGRTVGRDLVVVDDPARQKLKRAVTISLDDATCDMLRARHRAARQLAMRAGTSLDPDAYLLSEVEDETRHRRPGRALRRGVSCCRGYPPRRSSNFVALDSVAIPGRMTSTTRKVGTRGRANGAESVAAARRKATQLERHARDAARRAVAASERARAAHARAEQLAKRNGVRAAKRKAEPAVLLVSVADAAQRLGLSRATLYRWIAEGTVPTKRIGSSHLMIPTAWLDKVATG
jgi:excisionase family DNA binding protein